VAPFSSPVRTIAAGTGSLAIWGLLLVAFTGAARKRFKRSWRPLHYAAYPAMGFVLYHSVLGSDRRQVAAWGTVAAAVLIVRALILKQQTVRAISQSVIVPDALGEPVGLVSAGWDRGPADRAGPNSGSAQPGALLLVESPSPFARTARTKGWRRIRARLGGVDEKWVAAVVAVELISYGWLAVHLRRLAGSKSKQS